MRELTHSTARSRRAAVVAVALGALLLACVPSGSVVTGTYRVGTAPTSIGGDANLRLVRVLHDSRCPKEVQCVWAGDLVVSMAWSSRGTEVVVDVGWSVNHGATAVPGTAHTLTLHDLVGEGSGAVATVEVR